MADREPPTLGRLKRLGVGRVRVVCLNCHHAAELDVWAMIQIVGMGRRLDDLRFKCKTCGKRRVEFRMVSDTEDHKSAQEIAGRGTQDRISK